MQVPETINDSFIIGASNAPQREKLNSLAETTDTSSLLLHVEGPHRLWLQKVPVFYYSLRVSNQSEQETDGKTRPLHKGFLIMEMNTYPTRPHVAHVHM